MVLGHSHPDILKAVYDRMVNGLSFGAPTALEVEMAEKMVAMVPNIEMVRMVNSGTEAVMSAVRLARGATGRDKIIKFEGCYHGHSDAMLVGAGSGRAHAGRAGLQGRDKGRGAGYADGAVQRPGLGRAPAGREPGTGGGGDRRAGRGEYGRCAAEGRLFAGLTQLVRQARRAADFDEVITGFRLAAGGAQEYFGVRADLVTFGKIIGGGMPVGAYAGSRALMEQVAPCGPVYQAGTLSGNPVAMAAGLAQLQILTDHPEVYTVMETSAQYIANHLRASADKHGVKMQVNQVGSLLCPYFTDTPVDCFAAAKTSDTKKYAKYFNEMLLRGVYLAPSQFEAMFVSSAHTQKDLRSPCRRRRKPAHLTVLYCTFSRERSLRGRRARGRNRGFSLLQSPAFP